MSPEEGPPIPIASVIAETLKPTGTSSSVAPPASVIVTLRCVTSPVRAVLRSGVNSIFATGFGTTSTAISAVAAPAVAVIVTAPGAPRASTPRVRVRSMVGGRAIGMATASSEETQLTSSPSTSVPVSSVGSARTVTSVPAYSGPSAVTASDATGRGRMVSAIRCSRYPSASELRADGSGPEPTTRTITANSPGRRVEISPSRDTLKMLKPQVRFSRFQYWP